MPPLPMLAWLPLPIAFLLGSVPFGVIIARVHGVNLREHGSGNIGATNVWRTLGKKAGITCFLLDFLKGFLPVLLALTFPATVAHSAHIWIALTCALAAILGHNFSPWVQFKGGKGVATSAGAFAALAPAALIAALLVWIAVVNRTRMASLASMLGALALPLSYWLYSLLPASAPLHSSFQLPLFLLLCLAALLVILRHKSNIERIIKGTESKLGSKAER